MSNCSSRYRSSTQGLLQSMNSIQSLYQSQSISAIRYHEPFQVLITASYLSYILSQSLSKGIGLQIVDQVNILSTGEKGSFFILHFHQKSHFFDIQTQYQVEL